MMLGTDPEVFAYDVSKKKVIPAYFALGGDVDVELPFGKAYPDGAAVEFTVEPSESGAEIAQRIVANLDAIQERLDQQGLRISLLSNATVKEYIPQLPEELGPRASLQILGCNKDLSVYEKAGWVQTRNRPDPKVYPDRTIGTHIHVEIPEDLAGHWPFVQMATSYLDAVLGTSAIRVYGGDLPTRQRSLLYGGAGTIRLKTKAEDGYNAIEYRTLPSIAVLSRGATSAAVYFDTAKKVVERAEKMWREGYANQSAEEEDVKLATALRACVDDLGGINAIRSMVTSIQKFDSNEADFWSKHYLKKFGFSQDLFLSFRMYNHLYGGNS